MNRRTFLASFAALPALAIPHTTRPRLLVVDGNSLSDDPSPYYSGQRASWPICFQHEHAARLGITATINRAAGTWDVRDCAQRAPDAIDPLAALGDAWLCLWEGTNALARLRDPLAAWQAHADYLQARRAAGFARVFVGTVISREPSVSYTLDQRHEFNDLVRQNAASVGATVIDFAAMPDLGGDTDHGKTQYLYDGIHPTDTASHMIAAYAAQAMALPARLLFPIVTT